jgi:hypothetical protein
VPALSEQNGYVGKNLAPSILRLGHGLSCEKRELQTTVGEWGCAVKKLLLVLVVQL